MTIEAAPLAELVAEFIDELEAEYGEDAELADAVVIVEVRHKDEDGDPVNTVEGRSIGKRDTVFRGICWRALQT